ncbi:MAG: dihydrolipoyl dehydrogenase [Planctomycetota bacterium]|nr:MAG: dihydrolipoyl dehydrogenase [Planctomycetota bacterium]
MANLDVDLVVIGAGPGGYTGAFYAADHGLKVALVNKFPRLGGVCLNVGCIPSKALLHVSKLLNEAKEAKEMGVDFGKPKIDLEQVRAHKDSVVTKMVTGLDALSKARKVEKVFGLATFKDSNHILVDGSDGSTEITFKHCVIATGSTPIVPAVFDLKSDRVMDSTGALELRDIPDELLVVGGGVIGLELGSVYASLGSKVTVVEALPNLANGADADLVRPLEKRLKKQFESINKKSKVLSLKEVGEKIEAQYEVKNEVVTKEFDRVLLSIGRRPNSNGLGLEHAGIKVSERGFIEVDPRTLETSTKNIYAIGDVIGNPMLAHKSSAEAKVAVERILGKKTEFDVLGIPGVIYTDPEIAWVGLTEEEAKEKGIEYTLGRFPWGASGRATSVGRPEGLTKILFEPETERVLGVGMVGVGAGELIAEGGLALEMNAVMEDIAWTIHAHPTISETFMESAESLHGKATHIFTKKK